MKTARVCLLAAGLGSALCLAFALPVTVVEADTVHLKNGRRLEGKVIDNREKTGEVVVMIGELGSMTLRSGEVEKIEAGAGGGETVTRERVAVKVPNADWYRGSDTFEGVLSPETTDKTIVLETEAGKVRIERREKTAITKVDAAAIKPAAFTEEGGRRVIKTTHEVHLKNGRKLTGNVVATPESEPLKLEVGGMGRLTIRRDKIAESGVKEVAGTILLPEEPKAPAAPAETEKKPTEAEMREQLKREIRADVLRELLDQLIDEKVDAAAGAARTSSLLHEIQGGLSNDEILAIQDAARELGRQRTQNRVRAERHLVSMGSAVLPYLEPLASHPFPLTRRAVQRIVRDLGDLRGAPIAIEAINDPDEYVRALAGEALAAILPSAIAYRADADEKARLAAMAQYRGLWDEIVRENARDAVLKGLAAQN